jgi:hypothetical protein
MNVKIPFIICLALFSIQLNSAILCPPDKYLTCHDDIHYLPLVGSPTVLGGSGQLRYVDQSPNNACNVGHIIRTWYLDYNGNQNFDTGEHACLQNIYVSYTPGTTTIDWPTDIILDCKDQIPNTNPSWVSGPCDIIGVSKYDQIFGTDTKSCYKILRNFTVINWCTHVPGTNIGIWYHTQVIKIDDPSRPIIKNCDQVTLGTDVGCQANFTLTNSATDMSPCGQQKLLWKAEVDLWADGSIEYTFAHNHPDSLFRLDTVPSGQSVTINLPYPVIRGYHTVTWSVHDQCGNAAVCEQKVRVKDTKKPTPYMHDILSASFEGKDHPLRVPARIFNVGSFDNCTKPSQLRFSYSANVNDTIKVVNCNNAGFQFYTIFITDLEGNQETVDVFMLVYDNGACSNTLRLAGQVTEADNLPMTGVGFRLSRKSDATMEAMTQSNQSGQFLWENISLYQDMEVAPVFNKREQERLDIADIKMLQDYIMGRRGLINLQYLAADMDGDLAIRIKDVELLKNRILKPESFSGNHWSFAADIDSLANVTALKTVKNTIDLLNSDGILDFKAVYVGDITDANERKTGNRSSFSLTEELTDKSIQYILSQDADIEGLQVAIQLPNDALDVQINSDYFDVPNHSLHIDKNGLLRFVLTKKISLIEGDVLFSLSFGETMDGLESPELLEESKLLLADYRTSVLKIKNQNEGDIFIYPNPTVNGFTLDGDKVQIINIKNMAGQSIPYSINRNEVSWNVPSGIYIISVQVGDNVVSRKISKI